MDTSANSHLVEIITIGREILDGRVIDTNSVFVAEKLLTRGLVPRFGQRVDDHIDRVIEAFQIAANRSQYVLVTGGLGPTSDDLTIEAFAKFLGKELETNAQAYREVENTFKKLDRPFLDAQKKQALMPAGSVVMSNPEGTAPGVHYTTQGPRGSVSWFFMPGVPREMKRMLVEKVLPALPQVEGYMSHAWATQFTSEGELQTRLSSIQKRLGTHLELSYRTRFPENHIGLHGLCANPAARAEFETFKSEISTLLGNDVFCQGELQNLEEVVVSLLTRRMTKIGTVESCTGGLVAHRLTNVPGISSNFLGSWIVYDNGAKAALGIPYSLIENNGAVSKEVASLLAESGLLRLKELGAREAICVATTGIAGPTGGTPEKPVGLCWVAVAHSNKRTRVESIQGRIQLPRSDCKTLFSQKALDMVRRSLLEG